MAGLFNSGIRDYCGDDSNISKLSNHFLKDYTFKEEGINQINTSIDHQGAPQSFNLVDLLNSTRLIPNDLSYNDSPQIIPNIINENRNVCNVDNKNLIVDERPLQLYPSQFISPSYFSAPQQVFRAPHHSLVAHEWARSELAQYDCSIISENDMKNLMDSKEAGVSNLRFSDVIRYMTLQEEQNEIDLSNNDLKEANDDFLYDLDRDLKYMREKLVFNEQPINSWPQIISDIAHQSDVFDFIKDNQYSDSLKNIHENQDEKVEEIFNRGVKLYQEGYFSEAMLIFEAVVQVKPESESAWQYLALSLSENEQDHRATVACKKCLDLNKDNREILLSLARIHCNEMNIGATISCLERWLLSNPKYSDLVTVGQEAVHSVADKDDSMWHDLFEEAFESSGHFGIIQQQLNIAQQRNGLEIDAELEIAMGTLFHVIQDYSKSTVHFENAANVSKSSALLWNKLGTAYCNSGNFEKAINIYETALGLAPGFVRAECNLGVSLYNMGNYRDAVKHALKAYKLQHSIKPTGAGSAVTATNTITDTDPIWNLIRMSCFKMDRHDLDLVVFNRDMDTLCQEFGA